MLLDATVLAASPLFTGITAATLNGTVLALGEVGLVETDSAGPVPTIGLHPVVRDVNHHQASADNRYRYTALNLLSYVRYRVDPTDLDDWPLWRALLDHTSWPSS